MYDPDTQMMLSADAHGNIRRCNDAYIHRMGHQTSCLPYIIEEDREYGKAVFSALAARQETQITGTIRAVDKRDRPITMKFAATGIYNRHGLKQINLQTWVISERLLVNTGG